MRGTDLARGEGCARPDGGRITLMDDAGSAGLARMEAFFHGSPYTMHRHDSYAIGVTLAGVQCFTYRGERRHAHRGELHILFPDEPHDGAAGTEDGFGYRIAHFDAAVLQEALNGGPLPFVADPVVRPDGAWKDVLARLWDPDLAYDPALRTEVVADVIDGLERMAGHPPRRRGAIDVRRLHAVREAIASLPTEPLDMAGLERIAGMRRWTLARQFRAAFGTSPSRYRTSRQLGIVRSAIEAGMELAEAAHAAGFADQSHMTRKFRQAYGMSPGRWAGVLR